MSYDWSKGHVYNTPHQTSKVMIHPVADEEVKQKYKPKKR
jgi:mRNA export factor